jgi:hypothetical protein
MVTLNLSATTLFLIGVATGIVISSLSLIVVACVAAKKMSKKNKKGEY